MSYRIRNKERHAIVHKLANILGEIPEEETSGLVTDAQNLLLNREFGEEGRSRNSDPGDPYWFEHSLIKKSAQVIAEGDPIRAFAECLRETNHGHSGFVEQSRRVYKRPTNETEKQVSEEIRQMIINIITALFDSNPLSKEKGAFGDAWLSITAIVECLNLLGNDVPQKMVDGLKELLAGYEKIDGENQGLLEIKFWVDRHFG